MEKNAKQLVNEYCQREKIGNPAYTSTPGEKGPGGGYKCVLTVNGKTYETKEFEKTKKLAELAVAKIAMETLNLITTNDAVNTEPKGAKKAKTTNGETTAVPEQQSVVNKNLDEKAEVKKAVDKPLVKEPGWISIEKVEDIYKHLSDEVLAQEFKSFLHCKAQEEKKPYPVFTIADVTEPLAGFTCKVTYDGKVYDSLGLMNSKKQAEQSAAEVCMRSLGHFPSVPKDEYTIQVWKGGKLAAPRKVS